MGNADNANGNGLRPTDDPSIWAMPIPAEGTPPTLPAGQMVPTTPTTPAAKPTYSMDQVADFQFWLANEQSIMQAWREGRVLVIKDPTTGP